MRDQEDREVTNRERETLLARSRGGRGERGRVPTGGMGGFISVAMLTDLLEFVNHIT